MKSLAVDIGGTRIKLGIIEDGAIVRHRIIEAHADRYLGDDLPALQEAISSLGDNALHTFGGIGVALAGIVDSERKRLISSNGKYSRADEIDWERWAQDRFGLPIVVENDAKAALIGELSYGVGQHCRDAVMLILGTGVGTAAVMDAKLVRGRHFQAGCLGGHTTITIGKNPCSCGNIGCVEANASGWALPLRAREHNDFESSLLAACDPLDFQALKDCWEKGDPLARNLAETFCDCWSAGVINLIHAYDPELVILSGGVLHFRELGAMIIEKARRLAWTPWGQVQFRISTDPDRSVLLGLHKLLEDEIKS